MFIGTFVWDKTGGHYSMSTTNLAFCSDIVFDYKVGGWVSGMVG